MFNITYHPALAKLKNILFNIHLLLTSDTERQKVFATIPIIGFKKGKSLKDIIVKAKLPDIKEGSLNKSSKCGKSTCHVCKFIKEDSVFTDKKSENFYQLRRGVLNCDLENIVYLAG